MILVATILVLLTCCPFSSEEDTILYIPLKHSCRQLIDAQMEYAYGFKSEHTFLSDSNYNLHGLLDHGYYIELAIGQPEQLVNH